MSALRRLAADTRVATEQLRGDIAQAVSEASTIAMIFARQGAPRFTGELTNTVNGRGVKIHPSPAGTISIEDVVFVTAPHGPVMEEGRAKGATLPPVGPLFRWLKLRQDRGDVDLSWTKLTGDEAALAAALKLCYAIKKKGIQPRLFMEAAARKAEPVLFAGLDRVVDDWRRRLGA